MTKSASASSRFTLRSPPHFAKDSRVMKIFLRIVGVVVTLVVAFLLIGLLLPREIAIERSVDVAAPPEAVYPLVADLKRWPDWQAWNKEMDPTVTYTFSDPSAGEEAWYEWKGEKLSTGKVAITGVAPPKSVAYTVDFADSGANPGTMTFEEAAQPNQTHAVWTFQCDMGFSPIGRYVGLMMRGMLEKDFDTGLANLKKLAESEPRASITSESEATDAPTAEADTSAPADGASATDPVPADAEGGPEPTPDAVSPDAGSDVPIEADEASKEERALAPN